MLQSNFSCCPNKRENEQHNASNLSQWQRGAASLVSEAIVRKGEGEFPGPRYISMPVGSGKTTGAIEGVISLCEQHPEKTVVFLSPYVIGVEKVKEQLCQSLGKDHVGFYHAKANVSKLDEVKKQVFVGTHEFAAHNHLPLEDRDLVVVDEALYGTKDANLTTTQIYAVSAWARRNGILPDEFRAVFVCVDSMANNRKEGLRFEPIGIAGIESAVERISDYDFSAHSQTIGRTEPVHEVQVLCQGMLAGKAIVDHDGTDETTFMAGTLNIPAKQNAVILTATGGMVYKVSGGFKEIDSVKLQFVPPSYQNLELVQLSGPEIKGSYHTWGGTHKKAKVVDYVEWVLGQVPERKIYVSMPKKVIDKCLKGWCGLSARGDIDLPTKLNWNGKTVHLSHHQIGIGSNDFRNCEAVVYLWDNHLPKGVSLIRNHVLSDQAVAKEALAQANFGDLKGDYKEIRDAFLVENVIQQIGRGSIRNIGPDGAVAPMKAYLFVKEKTRAGVLRSLSGCSTSTLEGYDKLLKPTGRMDKVYLYLDSIKGRNVFGSEIKEQTGVTLSKIADKLEATKLEQYGYKFVRGRRGGEQHSFVWVGLPEEVKLFEYDSAA